MQNAVWKFSAVAGVLGICLLAVLQVQESLRTKDLDKLTESDKSVTLAPENKTPSENAPSVTTITSSPAPPANKNVNTQTAKVKSPTPKTIPTIDETSRPEKVASIPKYNPPSEVDNISKPEEEEIVGIDLNNELPEDEFEADSLTFDDEVDTKTNNINPESGSVVVAENISEHEHEHNINGIELTGNEEPQPLDNAPVSKKEGLKLLTRQPSNSTNEPEPLKLNLTDKAIPLEENEDSENSNPVEDFADESQLVELPAIDELNESPKIKEDPFADNEPLISSEEMNEEVTEDLEDTFPEEPNDKNDEEEPNGDPVPEDFKYDEELELKDDFGLKTEETPDLKPIPEETGNESKSPYLKNLSDEPDSIEPEEKPFQLTTGEEELEEPAITKEKTNNNSIGISPSTQKSNGIQRPHLKIEKIAPKNAVLGKPLIYSILIKNVGDRIARKIVVEDQIPKGTKLTGTIPQAEWVKNRLIWTFKELKPGEKKKIAIRVIPQKPGTIGSVATVRFATEIMAETLVSAPGITLDVKLPETAQVGQEVILKFTVKNSGKVIAHNVIIRNILPKMFSHSDGEDLEYEIGTMAAGETKEVALKISASQMGDGVNHASVTAKGGVTAKSKSPISVTGERLELVRRGPKTKFKGKEFIYSNTVQNKSRQTIKGARILEKVPEGLKFIGASNGGEYDEKKRIVSWNINSISPDETQEYKIKVVGYETGIKSSQVAVIDTNGARSIAKSETKIKGFSSLNLKLTSFDTPLTVGETIAVKVRAQNRGSASATNVQLNIQIPPELKLLEVKAPVKLQQIDDQVHQINIPKIEANSSFEVEIALKVLRSGEARLSSIIKSDQMNKSLTREEPLIIMGNE